MSATGIIHRALVTRLIRIGRGRILPLPASLTFRIGILIVSHWYLLATRPLHASWPLEENATAVPASDT
jgi:hypothetical protein